MVLVQITKHVLRHFPKFNPLREQEGEHIFPHGIPKFSNIAMSGNLLGASGFETRYHKLYKSNASWSTRFFDRTDVVQTLHSNSKYFFYFLGESNSETIIEY